MVNNRAGTASAPNSLTNPPSPRPPGPERGAVASRRWLWLLLLAALLALRLPSLAQPAGGDQGLYAYAGGQVRAGSVPYRDVWEQKPPGILALYAALGTIWPYESMVPAADLAVAALVAGLLVVLGRRRMTPAIGVASAALFLVVGDP